jgi:hypothetical protein
MICSAVYLWVAFLGPVPNLSLSSSTVLPGNLIVLAQSAGTRNDSTRRNAKDSAETASCRKFVGEFYAWYLARGKNTDPLRVALRRKRANFSPELIRRLNEDYGAAAKSPNEIVGLDGDPVLNSQDFADKYITGSVAQKDNRFLVDVFSITAGKRSEIPAVTPELRHQNGLWVFTNFHYKIDGKSDDLLSLLKRLKADRKKHR